MAEAGPAVAVWGVDHHRTPVAVRERLAVSGSELAALSRTLAALPGASEAVVLSTCNRLECYVGGAVDAARVAAAVAEFRGVEAGLGQTHGYWREGEACVRHLFRVVSGLESLVLGEHEIARQLKDAYESARAAGAAGSALNLLFQRALAVGKEVRTDTGIGRHKLSVASVAVDLARHVHGDLAQARLLVLGAGEVAELCVRHLLEQGVRRIGIVNRSQERAIALAELAQARTYPWSELGEALAEHDIVVASTAAPHAVVAEADVRAALRRRRRPLLLIDLAVPRDIDPEVGRIADVYLYNIDHLESVVAANRQLRAEEVAAAAAVIDANVAAFAAENQPGQNALLAQVAAYFRDIVAAEEARLAAKLGITEANRGELRYGLERVANKLQHRLLAWLREHPGEAMTERVVREILDLPRTEI
jgi:glutamyl-tRNA reductase